MVFETFNAPGLEHPAGAGPSFDRQSLYGGRDRHDASPRGRVPVDFGSEPTFYDSAFDKQDRCAPESDAKPRELLTAFLSLLSMFKRLTPQQFMEFNRMLFAALFGFNNGGDGGPDDRGGAHRGDNGGGHNGGGNRGGRGDQSKGGRKNGGGRTDGGRDGGGGRTDGGGRNGGDGSGQGDGGDDRGGRDYHPPRGREVLRLDFADGLKDKNVAYSMDDNKNNRGGSKITFKNVDGRNVANFRIDRLPGYPEGYEKTHPIPEDAPKSFRAEFGAFNPEDRLQPGHGYDVDFSVQFVDWQNDPSHWGDTIFQLRQSPNYGVPEMALGTHRGKLAVLQPNGTWHDTDINVADLGNKFHDFKIHMQMQKDDGSGGHFEIYLDGKKIYEKKDWHLKFGYGQGLPYTKFGIYKRVFEDSDPPPYKDTNGLRYREINFDYYNLTDVTK